MARFAYVYRLRDPNGREVISPEPVDATPEARAAAFRGQLVSPNGVHPEVFPPVSFTPVPINGEVEIVPGRWSLEIARETPMMPVGAATRTVEILIKHLEGGLTEETLGVASLKLRVAPGTPFGDALTDPSVRLAPAVELYERAGILLRFERVEPLDARFNAEEAFSRAHGGAPNAEFIELMTDFRRAPDVINAFFVTESNYNSYAGVATYAGADASLSARSSVFAGVVVATSRDHVRTFAHELGHHLGLYHTKDDQLKDTFAIDHYIAGDELRANHLPHSASANLMNEGGGDLLLTEEQVGVILRRPVVALYAPM